MPKLRVRDLQALLEDSSRDNQALKQRLLDMEALIKSLQSGTRPQETIPLNSSPSPPSTSPIISDPIMTATAKILKTHQMLRKLHHSYRVWMRKLGKNFL